MRTYSSTRLSKSNAIRKVLTFLFAKKIKDETTITMVNTLNTNKCVVSIEHKWRRKKLPWRKWEEGSRGGDRRGRETTISNEGTRTASIVNLYIENKLFKSSSSKRAAENYFVCTSGIISKMDRIITIVAIKYMCISVFFLYHYQHYLHWTNC